MREIDNQNIYLKNYLDFSYKGYLYTEAQTIFDILQFELNEPFVTLPLVSTLLYPLGNISGVYPIGGAIPLLNYPYEKIKIKIKWKCSVGTKVQLVFLSAQKTIIYNSGIYIAGSTEWEEKSVIMDIPETAEYITFYNPNLGTLTVEYLKLYSVEQSIPNALSKILLTDIDAIKNTFKMWLFSRRGDYGRKILKGGPLDWILGKPIDEVTSEEIKTTLIDEIKSNFYDLNTEDILIEKLLDTRGYKITLTISDDHNKYITNIPIILEG